MWADKNRLRFINCQKVLKIMRRWMCIWSILQDCHGRNLLSKLIKFWCCSAHLSSVSEIITNGMSILLQLSFQVLESIIQQNLSYLFTKKKPFNGELMKMKLTFPLSKKVKCLIIYQKKETLKDTEKNLTISESTKTLQLLHVANINKKTMWQ